MRMSNLHYTNSEPAFSDIPPPFLALILPHFLLVGGGGEKLQVIFH